MTRKTIKREAITLIVTLAALCILYFAFTLWLTFGKKKIYDKDGITIYANERVDPSMVAKVADEANSLLLKHRTKNKNTITCVFYDSDKEYRWRNLVIKSGSLAMNWIPTDFITFKPVDFAENKMFARLECLNNRSVSSVIAHEYVHTYQLHQLGFLRYRYYSFMNLWKIEGMAEYVSETSSFPLAKGLEYFTSSEKVQPSEDLEGEYFYFKSHLKADYLLRYKRIGEEEYWKTDFDQTSLEQEIREAIIIGQYRPDWEK
ncbi:MAG: hypothetical protein MJZ01_05385 [Bacteroidales bacterium]|nr:hypothetical protein [Bacteroidales bacterium]